MESARRASEIHKRRTGRSLRVTEQDVINEEMYEEEDDDIPLQYRRLTAHLQTGSPEFNSKLEAYLTSNIAVRDTLDNIIQNSIASDRQRPQSMYAPPPSMPLPMYQQQYMGSYVNPAATFPTTYTMPANGFHGRSASAVGTTTASHTATSSPHARPFIAPQKKSKSASPPLSSTRSAPKLARTPPQEQLKSDSPVPTLAATPGATPSSRTSSVSTQPQSRSDYQPLTMSLPTETQQLLAHGGDSNDPLYRSMMTHPQYFAPYQYFNSTSMSLSKQHNFRPTVSGMSATLAPSALDMKHTFSAHNHSNQDTYPVSASASSRAPLDLPSHHDSQQGPFSAPPFQANFGVNFPDLDTDALGRNGSSAQDSQQVTPGAERLDERLWAQFMSEDFDSCSPKDRLLDQYDRSD